MNVEISPVADLALRKQVERAVRPVLAGRDRKLVMREELFGHLTAIYAEELRQQSNEQAAMAAALERFGEPAVLTAELNASVGSAQRNAYHVDQWEDAMNRVLHYWFSQRAGESWFRLVLRSFFAIVLFNLIVWIIVPLLISILDLNGWLGDANTLFLVLKLFAFDVVVQIAIFAVLRQMFRIFDSRSGRSRWIWVCVQALLLSLFAAALGVPFRRLLLAGSLPTFQEIAEVAGSFAVGLSPCMVFGIWCRNHAKECRKKIERWTKLAIDE